ncbi:MAG: hypothetical protein EOO61_17710 [Hymenobacter sp.]|nr:MAG: hypothetical protein EOO61_17710 [Hymenobacter sp.]
MILGSGESGVGAALLGKQQGFEAEINALREEVKQLQSPGYVPTVLPEKQPIAEPVAKRQHVSSPLARS